MGIKWNITIRRYVLRFGVKLVRDLRRLLYAESGEILSFFLTILICHIKGYRSIFKIICKIHKASFAGWIIFSLAYANIRKLYFIEYLQTTSWCWFLSESKICHEISELDFFIFGGFFKKCQNVFFHYLILNGASALILITKIERSRIILFYQIIPNVSQNPFSALVFL